MPRLDFYNLNAHRAYPLVKQEPVFEYNGNTIILQTDVLLDCGFIMGPGTDPWPFLLQTIERDSDKVRFRFSHDYAIAFFVTESGTKYIQQNNGIAFLSVGDLHALYEAMGGDSVWTATDDYEVEPALVTQLGAVCNTLNVGYTPGAAWHLPAECGSSSGPGDVVVSGRNLRGTRLFSEGYNCSLMVSIRGNSLKFAANKGAGTGVLCGELLKGCPSSVVPQNDGIACADGICTINSVRPDAKGQFSLAAGSPGVKIQASPADHKIVIDFSLDELDTGHCLD